MKGPGTRERLGDRAIYPSAHQAARIWEDGCGEHDLAYARPAGRRRRRWEVKASAFHQSNLAARERSQA